MAVAKGDSIAQETTGCDSEIANDTKRCDTKLNDAELLAVCISCSRHWVKDLTKDGDIEHNPGPEWDPTTLTDEKVFPALKSNRTCERSSLRTCFGFTAPGCATGKWTGKVSGIDDQPPSIRKPETEGGNECQKQHRQQWFAKYGATVDGREVQHTESNRKVQRSTTMQWECSHCSFVNEWPAFVCGCCGEEDVCGGTPWLPARYSGRQKQVQTGDVQAARPKNRWLTEDVSVGDVPDNHGFDEPLVWHSEHPAKVRKTEHPNDMTIERLLQVLVEWLNGKGLTSVAERVLLDPC